MHVLRDLKEYLTAKYVSAEMTSNGKGQGVKDNMNVKTARFSFEKK